MGVGTRSAVAYVVVAVILVLLIALFVTFMVMNATSKRGPAAREQGGPPGIGTDEGTPLGDTPEHADERTTPPTVVGRHETDDPDDAAHLARPGEAEGETQIRFEPEQPAPDRLGDRERDR